MILAIQFYLRDPRWRVILCLEQVLINESLCSVITQGPGDWRKEADTGNKTLFPCPSLLTVVLVCLAICYNNKLMVNSVSQKSPDHDHHWPIGNSCLIPSDNFRLLDALMFKSRINLGFVSWIYLLNGVASRQGFKMLVVIFSYWR